MQRNGYQGMFHTLRRSEAVEIGATRGRQCRTDISMEETPRRGVSTALMGWAGQGVQCVITHPTQRASPQAARGGPSSG
jgi:hypothetical protein